ncbi:hypothetical protein [Solitalea koreensis]|uniref:Outer membrane protein beta-barrel domain-containing protein n=1 Tax=Solitalea koreensis TaxID=543615 RepID=A0A521BZQ6_9SPHI|nr:hypothetical protein [Solitalea koreensis]SMO51950.1 hypothetical protein SAMN06265350_10313 [Solitalea koreensis]
MKNLKLFLATALVVFLGLNTVSAQEAPGKKLFNVGFETGLTVGNLNDVYGTLFGGSLRYEMPFGAKLSGMLSAGYTSFIPKEDFKDVTDAFGVIPVKAGAKYYFSSNFYGSGELGAGFGTGDNSSTSFIYSPGIGYAFPVADEKFVDLGLRYEGQSVNGETNSFIGLRLGFAF